VATELPCAASMQDSPLIDAHVHFWDPGILAYPWLRDVPAIAEPHTPSVMRAEAGPDMPRQLVFVQAECERARALDEVAWVEGLACEEPRIAAIVAFAPVNDGPRTRDALATLAARPLVRGVRHLVQDDPDPDLCRRPAFVEGVREVGRLGFCFELCVRQAQLAAALDLVRACPDTCFVLDHGGKPEIRSAGVDPWRAHIDALAARPNVVCKLSGLVTEAGPIGASLQALQPYVDHLVSAFAPDRLLFGSDWPVLKMASGYRPWLALARELLRALSPAAQSAVFSGTARRTYGLS
jgi:L-fuconolactonase